MFKLNEKTESLFYSAVGIAVGELYTGVFSVRTRLDSLSQGERLTCYLGPRRQTNSGTNCMLPVNQSMTAFGACP